jgi:DnaK suppressor protein
MLSRASLQERENELQEMAGKKIMLAGVDRLDERVVTELQNIVSALAKMESGDYGRCESCRRRIATKRLTAIPWAALCKRCAQALENGSASANGTDESDGDIDPEFDDAQNVEWILDELDLKAEVTLDNVEINSIDGTIYLTGTVPNEREHQQLVEVIEEELGFDDVIDRLGIDTPGARGDGDDENDDKETVMQGEAVEDDPYSAFHENRSVVPPDQMVAEDDRM